MIVDGACAHIAHEFGKHVYLLAVNAVFCFSYAYRFFLLRGTLLLLSFVAVLLGGVFAPGYSLNLVFRFFLFNGPHLISRTVHRNL